jgi:shikimate kinase
MKQNERDQLIFLTGFMGSGKSTIGPILANTLGYRFVDLDKVIEEEAGKRIVEIFETMGEKAFRNLEQKTLLKVSRERECVVSLGGGTIAHDHNLALLKKSGSIVYLMLSPDEILRRVSSRTDRPLLKDERGEKLPEEQMRMKILALLRQREQYYSQADVIVATDTLSVGKAVDEIVKRLRL